MLAVHHLAKSFGLDPLFQNVNFTIQPGERLGLVGVNGCGKTTLMRILAGLERPDSGSVAYTPAQVRVGYLPQGYEFNGDETIQSFFTRAEGDLSALEERLLDLAAALGDDADQPDLLDAYDAILARLNAAAAATARLPGLLAAFGLDIFPPETPVRTLSGGQKTRLALAGVLHGAPEILLLDEPTNHLDLEMLEWLEGWLRGFSGALLIISHDRALLDAVATAILELDPLTRAVKLYPGGYTAYLEQKLAEREKGWQAFRDQQDEIARLRSAAAHIRGLARFRKGGKADSGDKFAKGFFGNRSLGTVRRAKSIEKRIEHLLNEDRVEKPGRMWQMRAEFGGAGESGRDALALDGLTVGYGQRALLENITVTLRYGRRAALLGANGSGKTTLLRTIAGMIPALAGQARLGARVRLGYMAQEQEVLEPAQNALQLLAGVLSQNETEVRAFLSKYLFTGDEVFLPAGRMSYGERSRLMLALLAAQGCNLLLLDEPVNHLDIPSRARFEEALSQFDGTVLAAAHDRYFIARFATEIWLVEGRGLRVEAVRQ